jgi:hypothetical protein
MQSRLMRAARFGLRTAAIAGVAIGGLWIGELVRPHRAQAEVYERAVRRTVGLLGALDLQPNRGGHRQLLINGVPVAAQLARSPDDPRELAEAIEREALRESLAGTDPGGSPEDQPFRRPFIARGEHWAAFGRFTGPGAGAGTRTLIEHLLAGEGLGPAARGGFFAFAQRAPQGRGSDVWLWQFEEGFDPRRLMGRPGADVQGQDLPSIDRYPGSLRVFTLSEVSDFHHSHAVAYQGRGTPAARRAHYARAFERAGFEPAPDGRRAGEAAAMIFRGERAEATVAVVPADGGDAIDLLQIRSLEAGSE